MLELKDSYSVGVASLDKQHKDLINMINALPSCEDFDEAIEFLKTYVEEHFFDEERLLSAAHFSGLPAHKLGHQKFVDWLSAMQEKFAGSVHNIEDLAAETHAYLSQWLISHILEDDMTYVGRILNIK